MIELLIIKCIALYIIAGPYFQVIQNDDIGYEIQHVLFTTSKWHLDQRRQVHCAWSQNITCYKIKRTILKQNEQTMFRQTTYQLLRFQ